MKVYWESVKRIVLFCAFIFGMLYVGYIFSSGLLNKIESKRELDSLEMENLKLDIELKKHKLKQ